ncbi:unnamed protein product, partial [Prorocentrum cordatum]
MTGALGSWTAEAGGPVGRRRWWVGHLRSHGFDFGFRSTSAGLTAEEAAHLTGSRQFGGGAMIGPRLMELALKQIEKEGCERGEADGQRDALPLRAECFGGPPEAVERSVCRMVKRRAGARSLAAKRCADLSVASARGAAGPIVGSLASSATRGALIAAASALSRAMARNATALNCATGAGTDALAFASMCNARGAAASPPGVADAGANSLARATAMDDAASSAFSDGDFVRSGARRAPDTTSVDSALVAAEDCGAEQCDGVQHQWPRVYERDEQRSDRDSVDYHVFWHSARDPHFDAVQRDGAERRGGVEFDDGAQHWQPDVYECDKQRSDHQVFSSASRANSASPGSATDIRSLTPAGKTTRAPATLSSAASRRGNASVDALSTAAVNAVRFVASSIAKRRCVVRRAVESATGRRGALLGAGGYRDPAPTVQADQPGILTFVFVYLYRGGTSWYAHDVGSHGEDRGSHDVAFSPQRCCGGGPVFESSGPGAGPAEGSSRRDVRHAVRGEALAAQRPRSEQRPDVLWRDDVDGGAEGSADAPRLSIKHERGELSQFSSSLREEPGEQSEDQSDFSAHSSDADEAEWNKGETLTITDIDNLRSILEAEGVNVARFGAPGTTYKSLQNLHQELMDGKCCMKKVDTESGTRIMRSMQVMRVKLMCNNMILCETHEQLPDGRLRSRNGYLPASKVRQNESLDQVFDRWAAEELQLTVLDEQKRDHALGGGL